MAQQGEDRDGGEPQRQLLGRGQNSLKAKPQILIGRSLVAIGTPFFFQCTRSSPRNSCHKALEWSGLFV